MKTTIQEQEGTVRVEMSHQEYMALSEVHSFLGRLYLDKYSQGKAPEWFEIPALWRNLMEAWREFREAQGL